MKDKRMVVLVILLVISLTANFFSFNRQENDVIEIVEMHLRQSGYNVGMQVATISEHESQEYIRITIRHMFDLSSDLVNESSLANSILGELDFVEHTLLSDSFLALPQEKHEQARRIINSKFEENNILGLDAKLIKLMQE